MLLLSLALSLLQGRERLLSLAHTLLGRLDQSERGFQVSFQLLDVNLRGTQGRLLRAPRLVELALGAINVSRRRLSLLLQVTLRLDELVLGGGGGADVGVELLELVVLFPDLDLQRLRVVGVVRDDAPPGRLHQIVELRVTPAFQDTLLRASLADVPDALVEDDRGALFLVRDQDGALDPGGIQQKVVNRVVLKLDHVRHLEVSRRRELVLGRGVLVDVEIDLGDDRCHAEVLHELGELGAVLVVAHQEGGELTSDFLLHGSRPHLILELDVGADRADGLGVEVSVGQLLDLFHQLGHLVAVPEKSLVALEL